MEIANESKIPACRERMWRGDLEWVVGRTGKHTARDKRRGTIVRDFPVLSSGATKNEVRFRRREKAKNAGEGQHKS